MGKYPYTIGILVVNILMFAFSNIWGQFLLVNFALFPIETDLFKYWQFLTHMFLHKDIIHIGLNMLVFTTVATHCESKLGGIKFLIFYLLGGIFAVSTHLVLTDMQSPIIGASGAVFSVMSLFAMFNPNDRFYLFFTPISVKMINLIIFFVFFELLSGILYPNDNVGHFAHFGGILFGFLYFLYLRYKTNVKSYIKTY